MDFCSVNKIYWQWLYLFDNLEQYESTVPCIWEGIEEKRREELYMIDILSVYEYICHGSIILWDSALRSWIEPTWTIEIDTYSTFNQVLM